jgi:hypothetical protein
MTFAAAFGALPFIGKAKERLPEGHEILKSFDARDWAKAFVAHVRQIPGLATDEETMATWFANALMRGYDEYHHIVDREVNESGKARIQYLSERAIRQWVAQGWCAETTKHKEMDCVLAEAISQNLIKVTDAVNEYRVRQWHVKYPCGCSAVTNGVEPLPTYCPEHKVAFREKATA